ncbi:17811_t:CDS:2, partial [Racocetra persica]
EMLNVPQLPLVNIESEIFQNDVGSNSKVVEYDQSSRNKFHEPERLVPPSEHEPTSTLYVKNFVRPLTLQMVRELLQQFGEIEYFWMDKIKSHCYYKTLASAINARQSLWHIIFPAETGRPLELEYVTIERAKELIATEEAKTIPPVGRD